MVGTHHLAAKAAAGSAVAPPGVGGATTGGIRVLQMAGSPAPAPASP
jgi:hypothetical protein